MSLQATPNGERVHIGFFGRRNAGKSSVVNAVTDQKLAVVSDVKGTTSDPVSKAMELLPIGPVLIIDTPGFDDAGALGELHMAKTRQVLNKIDIAVLVVDVLEGIKPCDEELISLFQRKNLPYLIVKNKCDLKPEAAPAAGNEICVSALHKQNIHALKERIASLFKEDEDARRIVGDLIAPHDLIVLVVPIDNAAPKGRLILPQQQTIRDILDADAAAIVAKYYELPAVLENLGKKPAMVITDSQVFQSAAKNTPLDVPLTSFSILLARYKGFLSCAIHGVTAIDKLKDGDTILVAEGCTHHRQCGDIGTVKLPKLLHAHTGKTFQYKTCSGTEYPEDLSPYALVLHCGSCIQNRREMLFRMKCAEDQNVPFTNYGISIAYMQGILKRSLGIFPELQKQIK